MARWGDIALAEEYLQRLLDANGGVVDVAQLHTYYIEHQWMKPIIGRISDFCESSDLLTYVPKQCDRKAHMILRAFEANSSDPKSRRSILGPFKSESLHDGHRFGSFMRAHIESYNRLCAIGPENTAATPVSVDIQGWQQVAIVYEYNQVDMEQAFSGESVPESDTAAPDEHPDALPVHDAEGGWSFIPKRVTSVTLPSPSPL